MSRKYTILPLALALAVMCQVPLFAQAPTGTILGTIKDSSGAVVPNATVFIINQNTQFKRTVISGESGDYEFTLVAAAPYTLTVEASQFKKYIQPDVPLTARQILRVDVTLQVGQTTETITVAATVTPVNSESAAIGESYSSAGLKNSPIPLPMDNYPTERIGNFSLQSVGVGGANYKVNGARMNQVRLTVDGRAAIYYGSVPLAATEEVKLVSSSANAEFATPATIQTTTKGGTNSFHVTADGILLHPALNSLGPIPQKRPAAIGNWNAAFSGGGPVIIPKIYNGKDRTWFFVDYDKSKDGSGNWRPILNVPTTLMRTGDFSQYKNNDGSLIPIIDPLTGTAFPGNVIPGNRVSPVSARIRDLYPIPNQGDPLTTFQNYAISFNYLSTKAHNRFMRFDQKLSNKDTLSYTNNSTSQDTAFDVAASGFAKLPQIANAVTSISQFSHAFAETHVFGPTLVNEFRYAFDRFLQPTGQDKKGQDILKAWGITGIDPSLDYTGLPNIRLGGGQVSSFPSLAGIGQVYNPATWLEHRNSFLDNLTWQKGRHTLKMGGNYARFAMTSSGSTSNPFGDFTFSGRLTQGNLGVAGSAWADLLLGYPSTVVRFTPRVTTQPFNFLFGAYIQDDWKVTPRLTINYGIRYDLEGSPVDQAGLYYGFNPKNGALVFPTQFAMDRVSKVFNNLIPLELASAAGYPSKIIPVDKNNFTPRLGLAFRPFNNAQTVIRAGYSIFSNGKLGSAWNRGVGTMLNSTGPFALSETFINQQPGGGTVGPPTLAFPSPFLASSGPNQGASYDVGFVTPNFHDAYVQQWNLTVEQELWKTAFRFSYLGSKSTNLLWSRNINQMQASTTPFNISGCADRATPRPSPTCRRNYYGFNNVNQTDTGGNAIYHSGQFEFTRPIASGFQLHGGYIWASEITDVEESSYLGVVGVDPYNRKYNRAKSNYIPAQRFQFDFFWQVPVGRGRRFLSSAPGIVNQIVGGWAFSGYANYMTGTPFSVTYSGRDTSGTGNTGGRADRIGLGRKANPPGNAWFDASAFTPPPCGTPDPVNYPSISCMPIGRFGNSGRNIIYGPTNSFAYGRTETFAAMKSFPLYKEAMRFTVTAYFANPFNRSYLYAPNANISDFQNVGRTTRYGNRTISLGGRFEF